MSCVWRLRAGASPTAIPAISTDYVGWRATQSPDPLVLMAPQWQYTSACPALPLSVQRLGPHTQAARAWPPRLLVSAMLLRSLLAGLWSSLHMRPMPGATQPGFAACTCIHPQLHEQPELPACLVTWAHLKELATRPVSQGGTNAHDQVRMKQVSFV